MSQLAFYDAPPPAQSHSETSRAAAEAIEPHVTAQQQQVLDALRAMGPMTDEAIQRFTGLAANSERPRRIELWKRGLVQQRGEGVTRSGRRAVRWGLA